MDASAKLRTAYERYRRAVFARARTLLGCDDSAKDVMQEAFIRLHQELHILDQPSPMAWLYRVTTNLCLNRLRDERRRTVLLASVRQGDVDPEDAEVRAVVLDILRRVPDDLREVAVYYYADEMTHEEIAALMGVSRRTIGNRLLSFDAIVTSVTGTENAS